MSSEKYHKPAPNDTSEPESIISDNPPITEAELSEIEDRYRYPSNLNNNITAFEDMHALIAALRQERKLSDEGAKLIEALNHYGVEDNPAGSVHAFHINVSNGFLVLCGMFLSDHRAARKGKGEKQ